jgi:hypothetical protein
MFLAARWPSESPQKVDTLRRAANKWRAESQYFYSGYALSQAMLGAFGGGSDEIRELARGSVNDYADCVAQSSEGALDALVAIWSSVVGMAMEFLHEDRDLVAELRRGLRGELARRLRNIGHEQADSRTRAGYLVNGLHIVTDMRGNWSAEFPEYAIHGSMTKGTPEGGYAFEIPSAFREFIELGDIEAAGSIADEMAESFVTPGLRGWQAAVRGLRDADHAAELFDEAAGRFEEDTLPEEGEIRPWSSINMHLWSKFFRARGLLARAAKVPDQSAELLTLASLSLVGTESGWVNPQVTCLRITLVALSRLARGDEPTNVIAEARNELVSANSWAGRSTDDRLVLSFLNRIEDALREVETEPGAAMATGVLRDALSVLGRVSMFGDDVARAISPAVGTGSFSTLVLGKYRTGIHKNLDSIKEETQLHTILLRLLQSRMPPYAHVRHGPLEYGKDVVSVIEKDGSNVLEMYQVKVGDMTLKGWREVRGQLEDMFLVTVPAVQIPVPIDSTEGFLFFNGHLRPDAEPAVAGWLAEQRDVHKRSISIMQIDQIASWIVGEHLETEFQAVLDEIGLGQDAPWPGGS